MGVSDEVVLSGGGPVVALLLPVLLLPVTVTPVGTVCQWVMGSPLASMASLGEVPLGGLLFRAESPGTSSGGEGLTAVSMMFDATPGFVSVHRACRGSPVD